MGVHEYTLPTPSWSAMKKLRPPTQHGVVRLPASWISRVNSPEPVGSTHRLPAAPPRYRFQRAGSTSVYRPSTIPPSGPYAIEAAGPNGIRLGSPPSGDTVCSWRPRVGCPYMVA